MTSHAVVCAYALLLVTSFISLISGYPHGYTWSQDHNSTTVDMCREDEGIETLCQRCAIKVRGNLVYPLCCNGLEETRPWCESYLKFGVLEDVK